MHAAADGLGLFRDTPGPHAMGVLRIAEAFALQRIQRRESSTQVRVWTDINACVRACVRRRQRVECGGGLRLSLAQGYKSLLGPVI